MKTYYKFCNLISVKGMEMLGVSFFCPVSTISFTTFATQLCFNVKSCGLSDITSLHLLPVNLRNQPNNSTSVIGTFPWHRVYDYAPIRWIAKISIQVFVGGHISH